MCTDERLVGVVGGNGNLRFITVQPFTHILVYAKGADASAFQFGFGEGLLQVEVSHVVFGKHLGESFIGFPFVAGNGFKIESVPFFLSLAFRGI